MMSDASCSALLVGEFLRLEKVWCVLEERASCPAVADDLARGRTNLPVGLPPQLLGLELLQALWQTRAQHGEARD